MVGLLVEFIQPAGKEQVLQKKKLALFKHNEPADEELCHG